MLLNGETDDSFIDPGAVRFFPNMRREASLSAEERDPRLRRKVVLGALDVELYTLIACEMISGWDLCRFAAAAGTMLCEDLERPCCSRESA